MTDHTKNIELELSDALKAELQPLLEQGQTIEAVKLCRERLDCDLVQAKALVDGLQPETSELEKSEAGLISPLGILVLALILGAYLYIR
jgi:ribosomal protein L7/L12